MNMKTSTSHNNANDYVNSLKMKQLSKFFNHYTPEAHSWRWLVQLLTFLELFNFVPRKITSLIQSI